MLQNDQTQRQVAGALGVSQSVVDKVASNLWCQQEADQWKIMCQSLRSGALHLCIGQRHRFESALSSLNKNNATHVQITCLILRNKPHCAKNPAVWSWLLPRHQQARQQSWWRQMMRDVSDNLCCLLISLCLDFRNGQKLLGEPGQCYAQCICAVCSCFGRG